MDFDSFQSVGELIELSVAPAFLLVASGSFINVATTRLGRVIDRARTLEIDFDEHRFDEGRNKEKCERHMIELRLLNRRMTVINTSIMFSTYAALMVACVVAMFFVSALTGFNAAFFVSILFIVTMGMMVAGLLFFLLEIFLATRYLRIHSEYLQE